MRRRAWMFTANAAFVFVGVAMLRAEDPVVPVYREPHHRQVFQYGSTRILDVRIPPGDTSWYHTHDAPILYVTLSNGQLRTQNLGQEWGGGAAGRGQAPGAAAPAAAQPPASATPAGPPPARLSSTITYGERPVTHRVQNVGDRLFHPIGVINESPGDEGTTEQAAGFDAKPELTNRYFRAYRFFLAPGESTPQHRHKVPAVLIQASDGRVLGTAAVKWDLNDPGRWAFFDAGDAHQIKNTGEARVELIEVEVRQPSR